MKRIMASRLIAELEAIVAKRGDLPVRISMSKDFCHHAGCVREGAITNDAIYASASRDGYGDEAMPVIRLSDYPPPASGEIS